MPALFLIILLAPLSGCNKMGFELQSPFASTSTEPSYGSAKLAPLQVQSEVMTFADTFATVMAQQWDDVARASDDARVSRICHIRKLGSIRAAYIIASSPNPIVNVVDMVTLVTLQRRGLETPRSMETFGNEWVYDLIGTTYEQEQRVWAIATRVLTVEQQAELQTLIDEWSRDNPDQRYTSSIRLQDFASARQDVTTVGQSSGNLFSLVFLDPLSGLDPAAKEVQKSRLLGERIFYYGSRLPQLLGWQVQSTFTSIATTPESADALESVSRFATAAERFALTAETLPQQLSEHTTVAIDQFFARLEEGDQLRTTLGELRQTIEASEQLALAVQSATAALDDLVARFDARAVQPAPGEPAKDVVADVGAAAVQTGAAADRVTLLVQSLDRLLASPALEAPSGNLQALTYEAQASGERLIDRAFWRALILLAVAPVAVAVGAAAYRRLQRRTSQGRAAN